MDIKEIREEKKEVEEAIFRILTKFSADTGLAVEGIDFSKIEQIGLKKIIYTSIDLDVRI